MNKNIKTLIATAVLGVATLGVYATRSFADANSNPNTNQLTPLVQLQKPESQHQLIRLIPARHHKAWNLGLNCNKHLSADDARTLTKAALLMQNRHDITIGKLTEKTNKKGTPIYMIELVNKQGALMSTVKVNSASGKIRPIHS